MAAVAVTPSNNTLFIRGFRNTVDIERIKDFFTFKGGECTVEFFKQSEDRGQLFVALKFASREVAKDLLRRYNNEVVLGSRIELSWYRDLRKARAQGRLGPWYPHRGRDRAAEAAYYERMHTRDRFRGGRRGGFHLRGHIGKYSSSSSDRESRSRSRSVSQDRTYSHGGSRSRSRGRDDSRSRSRSDSRSAVKRRRSESGSPGRIHRDRSSDHHGYIASPDNGHHRDFDNDRDNDWARVEPSRWDATPDGSADPTPPRGMRSEVAPSGRDEEHYRDRIQSPMSVQDSTPDRFQGESRGFSGGNRGSSSTTTTRRLSDRPSESPAETRSKEGNGRGSFSHDTSTPVESRRGRPHDSVNTSLEMEREVEKGMMGVSHDKMILIREKKEDIEKAYRQDCEVFSSVIKMLISKDSDLEEKIQASLRENLKEIGQRCIHELREFIEGLRTQSESRA